MAYSSWLDYLQRLWERVIPPSGSLAHRREAQIEKLEAAARGEESKNAKLAEFLEFKQKEAGVIGRIQEARTERVRLWSKLGDFGVRGPISARFLIVVAIAIGFLILFLVTC